MTWVGGGSFASVESGGQRRFFISYAHGAEEDAQLRTRLAEALVAAGHRVFFDGMMKFGSTWADEIERELSECDFFVLLLSKHALRSELVLQEVERVRDRRKAGPSPLILTVRVDLEGALPYRWGAYLDSFQWKMWRGEADFGPLLKAILDVAGSGKEAPADGAPGEAPAEDFRHPVPSVDLRSVVAPGGAMPPEDPFYVSREADGEVLEYAGRAGETVVVKAPRQMGKSSLLKRYLLRCQQAGKRTALIDLSLFSDFDLREYPTFLSCLAVDVLEKLGLDAEDRPRIQTQPDLTYFLQRRVLGALQEPIVLAFDEVDRLLGQPYASSFFSMLRYWHERRTDPNQERTGWPRLELALVISTEPYLLIDDAMRSPFNVRAPILLRCFTKAECHDLNDRYRGMLPEREVASLHELLGGQPYLTRLAYYHLARAGERGVAGLAVEDGGLFRDHLGSLLGKLRKQNLLAAMKQAIATGTAPAGAFERLEGAGLVRMEAGRILAANQLYQRFFRTAT